MLRDEILEAIDFDFMETGDSIEKYMEYLKEDKVNNDVISELIDWGINITPEEIDYIYSEEGLQEIYKYIMLDK